MNSVVHAVGWTLFISGWLVAFAGTLWIIAAAWQRNILWGLICILVPVIQLVYIAAHWKDAKEGFFLQLAGVALIVLSWWMGVPRS
ncbi:MAG TPA: hypothetical protein VGD60_15120 [Candidatus Acidoferrales bacterium]